MASTSSFVITVRLKSIISSSWFRNGLDSGWHSTEISISLNKQQTHSPLSSVIPKKERTSSLCVWSSKFRLSYRMVNLTKFFILVMTWTTTTTAWMAPLLRRGSILRSKRTVVPSAWIPSSKTLSHRMMGGDVTSPMPRHSGLLSSRLWSSSSSSSSSTTATTPEGGGGEEKSEEEKARIKAEREARK